MGLYRGLVDCVYVPSNGVKLDVFRKDYDFKSRHEINVLYLGAVSPAKGVQDLLGAIPNVLANDNRFRFHFVGDIFRKSAMDYIKDKSLDVHTILKSKSLSSYVTFYGHLEGTDKEDKMREADLFVFPSYSEGSPFSIVEAMEYGLPIIATRVGNLPEILKDEENVLFVDFNAPEQIKDAILRLANDEELARNMVCNNFAVLNGVLSLIKYESKMISIFYEAARK